MRNKRIVFSAALALTLLFQATCMEIVRPQFSVRQTSESPSLSSVAIAAVSELEKPAPEVVTSSPRATRPPKSVVQEDVPLDRQEAAAQLGRLPTSKRIDFITHYRQGLGLARLYQVERALVEFERCLEVVPGHPDALFQKARMVLHTEGPSAVVALLGQLRGNNSDALPVRRILRNLYRESGPLSDEIKEAEEQEAISSIIGELGEFDQALETWLHTGDGPDPRNGILGQFKNLDQMSDSPYSRLVRIYALREGARALGSVVLDHCLEADRAFKVLMNEFPGLVGVLLEHGRWLLMSQIRFDLVEDPEEPPADSSITLDIAQLYFEQAFDASPLSSHGAYAALLNLGHVARDMGDFDQAIQLYGVLLAQFGVSENYQREAHFNTGVVQYRLGNMDEARKSFLKCEELKNDIISQWFLHLSGARELPFRPEPITDEHRRTLKFTDVAEELGVDKYDGAGPSAWCDVDLDGDLDLFACGCDTFSALYRNEGDHFVDASREAGLVNVASGFSSTFADYDNDGDCDLYIGRNGWSGPARNSLYRNKGDGTFEDVTDLAGVGDPGSTFVHGWADFDRDGFLDLFVANGVTKDGSTNCLYHNNGDGTFTDITSEVGLAERPGVRTIGFGIGDYNLDGWPDIFVNSWGTRNRLYQNQGEGRFADVASFAGVDGSRFPLSGYLGFIMDFDNDTWPDILLTKLGFFHVTLQGMLEDFETSRVSEHYSTRLFRNRGDGWSFEDISESAGLRYVHGSMGGNVGDLNNDGYLDFYLGTGDPWMPRLEPNALYINEGDGTFVDLTRFTGLGHLGKGHGITFADYDFDGDLDIYAPQGGFVHGDLWHNALYRNEKGNINNWLQLLLEGTKSNRMGVGAQILLRSGDVTLYREMTAGGAFGSSSSPYVHFGLGRLKKIDSLEVKWPSGQVDTYTPVPINRFLKVTESKNTLDMISPPSHSKK